MTCCTFNPDFRDDWRKLDAIRDHNAKVHHRRSGPDTVHHHHYGDDVPNWWWRKVNR